MKPAEIKILLSHVGISPTKYRGQNFLCNEKVIEKIIHAADIKPGDRVLEIGPGLGVLTRALVKSGAHVLAVELDHNFAPMLMADPMLQGNSHVPDVESLDVRDVPRGLAKILEDDILKCRNANLVKELGGVPYKLVANIPYNITGAIIEKFLEEEPRPSVLVLMVQAEVAERLISHKPMSLAGVLTTYLATVERVAKVSRESFWPAPKVDSAVIRITPHAKEILATQPAPDAIFPLIKAGFANRRKQLAHNLAVFLGSRDKAHEALTAAAIPPTARAETLAIADWIKLAHMLK